MMSESCRAVEPLLGELAARGGDPRTEQIAREHVRRCDDCALLLSELSAAWRSLDRWETPAPPAHVETAVFEAVRADLARRSSPRLVFVSLGLGFVASLLSAFLVRLRMPLGGSSLALFFCGGIWTGAYALAFHAVLSRRPAPAARAALWASAALVALSLLCPMGQLVDVCHAEAAITRWLGHDQAGYFLAGLVCMGSCPRLPGSWRFAGREGDASAGSLPPWRRCSPSSFRSSTCNAGRSPWAPPRAPSAAPSWARPSPGSRTCPGGRARRAVL